MSTKKSRPTPPQSQPTKIIKHITADFIAKCVAYASQFDLTHAVLFCTGAVITWGALK